MKLIYLMIAVGLASLILLYIFITQGNKIAAAITFMLAAFTMILLNNIYVKKDLNKLIAEVKKGQNKVLEEIEKNQ